MTVKVYNTLSRKKEELVPRDGRKLTVYVCGPTVYNYIHIGNARCYIAFDAIIRYLRFRGFDVQYVRNITDVDDKILNRAAEEGIPPQAVAAKYIEAFEADMKILGVDAPDVSPKATEHIPEMLTMVQTLIDKGYAYESQGDVFFDVTRFEGYGKLSHRSLKEMRAGQRIEPSPNKRNPLDFALWKGAKTGEIAWPSPWGNGRPGWHLECSIMSLKYLKMGFDVHGGGQDLIFPHHENEIAQSEASTGTKPFVRYWLHNGFVNIDQEKMAKSLGNVVLVRDLFLEQGNKALSYIVAGALRILFLSTHYRSPIDFSGDKLRETTHAYGGLEDTVRYLRELPGATNVTEAEEEDAALRGVAAKIADVEARFVEAMDDDFNTATALAQLFSLRNEVETFLKRRSSLTRRAMEVLGKAEGTLIGLGKVLGLRLGQFRLDEFLYWLPEQSVRSLGGALKATGHPYSASEEKEALTERGNVGAVVGSLIAAREAMRADKNWTGADKVRAELMKSGLEVEDTARGARLKVSFLRFIALFKAGKPLETWLS